MTHNSSLSMVNHQHVSVMSVYRSSASLFAPGFFLSPARISGPGDTFIPLPHWCWMSVIHGCPSSVIRPSLLLLPVLGTVCPNMSCPHPLCLFSEVASRLCSFGVHSHDFYCNFCSAYAVTVVIFGHFNRSFLLCLLTWSCHILELHRSTQFPCCYSQDLEQPLSQLKDRYIKLRRVQIWP